MPTAPFISHPVAGHDFIGRQGLVRNLRGRIVAGESVAIIGGPKLGKTSLAHKVLEGLLDVRVIEMDLRGKPSSIPQGICGAIVILDNVDHLSIRETGALLADVSAASPRNIILTGGTRLRLWLSTAELLPGMTIRLYPLSVLLDGELRELAGNNVVTSIARWSGNHPYLTKLFLHYGEAALSAGRQQWEPFIRQWNEAIGKSPERRVLRYLVDRGQPVNPKKVGAETGIEDIKTVADRLVYLGAISRWIRNDEATLFAGCRLLNNCVTGRSLELAE
jgi:hypothetical protein